MGENILEVAGVSFYMLKVAESNEINMMSIKSFIIKIKENYHTRKYKINEVCIVKTL